MARNTKGWECRVAEAARLEYKSQVSQAVTRVRKTHGRTSWETLLSKEKIWELFRRKNEQDLRGASYSFTWDTVISRQQNTCVKYRNLGNLIIERFMWCTINLKIQLDSVVVYSCEPKKKKKTPAYFTSSQSPEHSWQLCLSLGRRWINSIPILTPPTLSSRLRANPCPSVMVRQPAMPPPPPPSCIIFASTVSHDSSTKICS